MSATIAATALAIAGAGALALLAARIFGALYANYLLRRAFRDHAMNRQGSYGGEE